MSLSKVKSVESLMAALEQDRNQGARLVTTNGCFDLLHVGHLRYLQAAKAFGDKLIILLNSDASVQRLKGPSRPVVSQQERAEMLAGLSCVDYVTVFDEDTPAALLEVIRPNVHVKGGDYTPESLPETPVLRKVGAELQLVSFVDGYSTSNLIQRILDTFQQQRV